jgi:hypothetical protein
MSIPGSLPLDSDEEEEELDDEDEAPFFFLDLTWSAPISASMSASCFRAASIGAWSRKKSIMNYR